MSKFLSVKTPPAGDGLRKSQNVIKSLRSWEGKRAEIGLKNPLRINEVSHIITVCYPAKRSRDGFVCLLPVHRLQIFILHVISKE
jgi:hypothetical protein